MGGRGSKGAKSMATPRKKNRAKSEQDNLPTDRLTYGEKDPHIDSGTRAVIEEFENQRRSAKIEYNMSVDSKGIRRDMNKGGRTSCSVSRYWLDNCVSHTHNHPLGLVANGYDIRYELGGTFSVADLKNFFTTNCPNYRATAAEGTYSISKLPNTDGGGALLAYQRAQKAIIGANKARVDKLNEKFLQSDGAMRYEDYLTEHAKIWSTALIEMHNWLLNNQSKYNYYYTLERA